MTDMRSLIAELPEQLAWASSLEPAGVPRASAAIVAGMGGSGFAGDVARVYAAEQGARVAVHKSYGLPGWASDSGGLVIPVSHSGNTEETLSAADAARKAGMPVVTTSTGGTLGDAGANHVPIPPGPQPRAAAGYLAGAVLRILDAAGIVTGSREALDEASEVTAAMLDDDVGERAAAIASALMGRATIIYGGDGIPAAAAGRWKTQINENSKAPAWWTPFPELNHNEIVGWTAFPDLGRDAVGVVFLHDSGDHPRIARRAELTAELMGDVHIAGRVTSEGAGPLARLFSLVLVGDLVSVSLAELAGVDPVPVAVIESLKERLRAHGNRIAPGSGSGLRKSES
jgi:glucose/mannose-6-phosphate isomerase